MTRLSRGKDPAGLVSIEANIIEEENGAKQWLKIVISDDGGGIDPARVREKLTLMDPEGPWKEQDDHTVMQNIFMFGVSTREDVSDLSGRGVGMNVVKREVENLGGDIEVFSELYLWTKFVIKVPYKLSV